ncbi:MAG TPA: hypothetical protein VJS91_09095 [Nitrososphaeraceae archaeon]|nr:hypothetical protein [Nitrososphaeraceae archaeon]
MSDAYSHVIEMLSDIEDEHKLPHGILKQIYDKEKDVVFMGVRSNILIDIKRIVTSEFENFSG